MNNKFLRNILFLQNLMSSFSKCVDLTMIIILVNLI